MFINVIRQIRESTDNGKLVSEHDNVLLIRINFKY